MVHILQFNPKEMLDAKVQIDEFVAHARRNYMGIIGLDEEDFDKSVWTFDMRVLGQKRVKNAHIKFTRHEIRAARGEILPSSDQLIQEPFLAFMKALFLQKLVSDQTQATSDMMTVLKALEYVVRKRLGDKAHPCLIAKDDFISASRLVSEQAEKSAYRRDVQFQAFLSLLNKHGLVSKRLAWKSTRAKPRELRMDISQEAEARRQEKMPSHKAILTLMHLAIWALDGDLYKKMPATTSDGDNISFCRRIAQSDEKDGPVVLGLALCAIGLNCRVTELALMPWDAQSFTLAKGEIDSDGFAEDEDRFALRWRPVKGGAPMVKPFSRDFAGFAQFIIEKLQEFSTAPRAVAKHYELNPNQLYLPQNLEHLRGADWISAEEAAEIIGIGLQSLPFWASSNGLKTKRFHRGNDMVVGVAYEFASLESALLKKLPSGFPYLVGNLKFSEAMFCCFLNQSHLTRGTCRVIPSHFKQSVFEEVLTERKSVKGHQSVFERYGFYEEDGSKIDITTHEFRHFWQTALKKAGVSELISAYAAGRRNPNQNEFYDLNSPSDAATLSFDIVNRSQQKLFEQSALAIVHDVLESSITGASSSASIVSFSEHTIVTFDKDSGALNIQGCHLSKYGLCGHNYVSSGCKKFLQCLECDELFCVKGVQQFEQNAVDKANALRQLLSEYRQQVIEDVVDGVKDADNWLAKAERQLAKLDALINDIYLNESVPKGTVVQLSAELKNTTALGQALIERLGPIMAKRDALQPVKTLACDEVEA